MHVVNDTSPYSYVDDVIISSMGDTPREAVVEGLQEATNGLVHWTDENKMSIQPDKGEWMIASMGHFDPANFIIPRRPIPIGHYLFQDAISPFPPVPATYRPGLSLPF